MKWRTIPVSGVFEYSEEIKAIARKEALAAVVDMKIELTDEGELDVSKLGEKWRQQISSRYSMLEHKFKDKVDDLIVFSDRADAYACNYEASLRANASRLAKTLLSDDEKKLTTAKGCREFFTCGALLSQHYLSYCQAISSDANQLSRMPDTGDVLKALSLNRALQAALFIDESIEKALNLLCDAANAIHIADGGDSKIDSLIEYKANLRLNGRKGGKNRHEDMDKLKKWTIDKYINDFPANKWKSASAAAYALQDDVISQGKIIGSNAVLAPSNAQKTIASWISAYKKSV